MVSKGKTCPSQTKSSAHYYGLQSAWNKFVLLLFWSSCVIMDVTDNCNTIFYAYLKILFTRYFRRYSSIFLEFLPQFIFLVFLFFWMVVMMFMKWIMYSPVAGKNYTFHNFTQFIVYFYCFCRKSEIPPRLRSFCIDIFHQYDAVQRFDSTRWLWSVYVWRSAQVAEGFGVCVAALHSRHASRQAVVYYVDKKITQTKGEFVNFYFYKCNAVWIKLVFYIQLFWKCLSSRFLLNFIFFFIIASVISNFMDCMGRLAKAIDFAVIWSDI